MIETLTIGLRHGDYCLLWRAAMHRYDIELRAAENQSHIYTMCVVHQCTAWHEAYAQQRCVAVENFFPATLSEGSVCVDRLEDRTTPRLCNDGKDL